MKRKEKERFGGSEKERQSEKEAKRERGKGEVRKLEHAKEKNRKL